MPALLPHLREQRLLDVQEVAGRAGIHGRAHGAERADDLGGLQLLAIGLAVVGTQLADQFATSGQQLLEQVERRHVLRRIGVGFGLAHPRRVGALGRLHASPATAPLAAAAAVPSPIAVGRTRIGTKVRLAGCRRRPRRR